MIKVRWQVLLFGGTCIWEEAPGRLPSAGHVLSLDLRRDYTNVPFVKIHHLCMPYLCTLLYVCYTEIKGLFKK